MTFEVSKIRIIAMGVMCFAIAGLIYALLGSEAAQNEDNTLMLAYALIVLMLGCGIFLVVLAFKSPPLHVNDDGIHYARWYDAPIPWDSITQITTVGASAEKFAPTVNAVGAGLSGQAKRQLASSQKFITLGFSPAFEANAELTATARRELKVNRIAAIQGLTIPATLFGKQLGAIEDSLRTYAPDHIIWNS